MAENKQCTCGAGHEGHLCVLYSRELTKEIAERTDMPAVVCFICGREANCPESVCSPMPIEEK